MAVDWESLVNSFSVSDIGRSTLADILREQDARIKAMSNEKAQRAICIEDLRRQISELETTRADFGRLQDAYKSQSEALAGAARDHEALRKQLVAEVKKRDDRIAELEAKEPSDAE